MTNCNICGKVLMDGAEILNDFYTYENRRNKFKEVFICWDCGNSNKVKGSLIEKKYRFVGLKRKP